MRRLLQIALLIIFPAVAAAQTVAGLAAVAMVARLARPVRFLVVAARLPVHLERRVDRRRHRPHPRRRRHRIRW